MVRLSQPRRLVAEDEALIGMALEIYLENGGFDVAGPFASSVEAFSSVEQGAPDLAILDFRLRDGPCTDLAKTPLGRGIPAVMCSGSPRWIDVPPELGAVAWLENPVDRAILMEVVAHVAPSPARGVPDPAL